MTDAGAELGVDPLLAESEGLEPQDLRPARQAPDNPLVLAHFEELIPDPYNVRQELRNIAGLKRSILEHGLLENLVGVEVPEHLRTGEAWIEVKAGSRRYEALRQLRAEGLFPLDRLIPVVLRDSRGFWENLVENVERVDVDPWDIGRRLSEAASSGLSNRQISTRINRSVGWVNRHIHIGTGLSPDAIAFIRKNKLDIHMGELFRLSFLKDQYGDPDGEAQIAALGRQRGRRSPRPRDKDDLRAFSNRINYLKTQMPVPPLIRPVVGAVLQYLEGGGRPNFRKLTEIIMGDRVRLLGGTSDED